MKASTLGADMLCGWCACSPADQIFCISQVWTKWRWTEDQTIQFTRDEGFWRKSTVFVLQLKKAEIKLKFWTNEVLCWNFIIRRCQNNRKSLPLFNSGKQISIRGSEKYTVTVFMLSHVNLFLSHFVICHCTLWGSPCYSTWWSDGKWFACQHHHRLLSPSQSLTCSLTQSAQKMTHMYCKGHPSEWWRREALSVGFPCQFFCQ